MERADVWNFAGPDVFNSGGLINNVVNFALPASPPTGPFLVRTLGGTSDTPVITFTGITSAAVPRHTSQRIVALGERSRSDDTAGLADSMPRPKSYSWFGISKSGDADILNHSDRQPLAGGCRRHQPAGPGSG